MAKEVELKFVTMDANDVRFAKDCVNPTDLPKTYDRRTDKQIDADYVMTYSMKRTKRICDV
jgi:hypothetical protein